MITPQKLKEARQTLWPISETITTERQSKELAAAFCKVSWKTWEAWELGTYAPPEWQVGNLERIIDGDI